MRADECDALKLDRQLCFPLYAAAREVTKKYRPFLDALNLTYTQYISLIVLWEKGSCSVKELGKKLYLDSGTLTPVLKSLEQKGFVSRGRSQKDERILVVSITPEGMKLREKAAAIPGGVGACLHLSPEEAQTLYTLLYKLLESMEKN